MKINKIADIEKDFSKWYTDAIEAAELISYANVKGCINYLPNGWSVWTNIQSELDKRFKSLDIKNVQLPLFIKMSDFSKEKKHIEGFAPEAFVVDKQGNENLSDPLILRPTSEVLFSQVFKDMINSYNDLPLKYNQWCSVYRAEKTTRPFLRGAEFHWSELHCLFDNENDAIEMAKKILQVYVDFFKYVLCIPVLSGAKTVGERFAGAVETYTVEAWSKDGQAIQAGTSHYLGQNFSKMYDLKFQNKDNAWSMPYYTSHGVSTRMVGAIIVVHGDAKGIVLPPLLAPTQIAILTLFADKDPNVLNVSEKVQKELSKYYRVSIDNTSNSFGFKISNQEVLGTPISIVLGPKDVANNIATVIRRDTGEKITVSLDQLTKTIQELITSYSTSLYNKALSNLNSSIVKVDTLDEFKKVISENKIALAPWGGNEEDEKRLKTELGISPRCIKEYNIGGTCFFTNKPAKELVYFARAY